MTLSDLVADFRKHHMEPKIVSIREEMTDWGFLKWTVLLDDGRHASTIKRDLAQECYRLKGLGVPVDLQRQRRHVGSFTLTAIAPLVIRA